MERPNQSSIDDLIGLSRLLGEFGQIQRTVLLPGGAPESDSHHSFALALTVFEFAARFAPELDPGKLLLYSLVHDLIELITGDVPTLTASTAELVAKDQSEAEALEALERKLALAPHILIALKTY